MTVPPLPYDRAPSRELLTLLLPGGLLEPVLTLHNQDLGGLALDVHFRRENKIYVYWGRTRILIVEPLLDNVVKITADRKYAAQPCANNLFDTWHSGDLGLGKALKTYLRDVKVTPSFIEGEGVIHTNWSLIRDPWVPFDREAILGYESTAHREESRSFPEVEAARRELQAIYEASYKKSQLCKKWGKPPRRRKRDKVDQLAIDPEGHLVLIELKDASSEKDDKMYYAPFQLLRYIWAWHSALDDVRGGLQQLIDVRVALELMPAVPWLTGGIRPVVGFGHDTRCKKTKRRYCRVLEVVNQYLPAGVSRIETWEYGDDGPRQVG